MENFSFVNPVKIIFGKDTIQNLVAEIPSKNKTLVIYGGGSIKKNGVYDQISKALSSFEWYEFAGIEANPYYETCMKVVEVIREKKIDFLLAVGGGSVIDATKFIAAAACFENGDPWQILSKRLKIEKALPFGSILTLPATGSEMNDGAVISKAATEEKLAFGSPLVYPKFSILDPTTTYSLPTRQIGNGIVDAFVHVVEQYLTYPVNALLQDYMAEAILKTLILEGPRSLRDPMNYDARANLMWACSWALNGWISCGVPSDWATHMIGHELTAFYGLDHAQTLAIVLPGVMTVLKEQKSEKIQRLGKEVFGINASSSEELTDKSILAVEDFFEKAGVKTHLSDYGLGQEAIDKVCQRFVQRGWKLGEKQNITADTVREILKLRV